MNKAEFTDLIINPAKLGNEHIDTLKKIVADYPYFSTAQILLAKALLNTHHYEYEKQLKTTALSVANREVLNHFINNISEDTDDTDNIEEENSMIQVEDEIKVEEVSLLDFDSEKLEQDALLIEAQNILSNNEIPSLEISIETENLPNNNTELEAENIESESNHFEYIAPVLENIVHEIALVDRIVGPCTQRRLLIIVLITPAIAPRVDPGTVDIVVHKTSLVDRNRRPMKNSRCHNSG